MKGEVIMIKLMYRAILKKGFLIIEEIEVNEETKQVIGLKDVKVIKTYVS
jgi:hypothetical protein